MVPNNPKALNNRALAYKKVGQFDLMYNDSQAAIENDDLNYRCYLRNGEACFELSKSKLVTDLKLCDKGLRRFKNAITILE